MMFLIIAFQLFTFMYLIIINFQFIYFNNLF